MKHRALTAILLTLLLAACRAETPVENEPSPATDATTTQSETASATHPASPGGTALVPDVTSGTTVLVVLEDNSLGLPGQPIPPGPAVLTIENRGALVHNLFIQGAGIDRAAGDSIEAGKSATLDVLFKPGTYTFYCPIPNHRKNGEEATITIGTQ
jgi:hypothetical protein